MHYYSNLELFITLYVISLSISLLGPSKFYFLNFIFDSIFVGGVYYFVSYFDLNLSSMINGLTFDLYKDFITKTAGVSLLFMVLFRFTISNTVYNSLFMGHIAFLTIFYSVIFLVDQVGYAGEYHRTFFVNFPLLPYLFFIVFLLAFLQFKLTLTALFGMNAILD